jgi:MoxR-like ATPase
VITSNRTREVHDALKRRCLCYWIDYPSFEKELEIVLTRLPHTPEKLAHQVTGFIQ